MRGFGEALRAAGHVARHGTTSDGAIVCCPECNELRWQVVPTISGDLWEPDRRGSG
jgi:hypothetical protein